MILAISLGNRSARADTFEIQFTAIDFTNLSGNGVVPPTDPLSGIITYESTGISDPTLSFDSINLTIDGHSYSPGDLGFFQDPGSSMNQIGALAGGTTVIHNQTDDFTFVWNRDTLAPFEILYSSAQRDGIFLSTTFTSSSVSPVPEPSETALFFLAGGALLPMVHQQRQKRRLSPPGRLKS